MWAPSSRALLIRLRTPTKWTPNLQQQPNLSLPSTLKKTQACSRRTAGLLPVLVLTSASASQRIYVLNIRAFSSQSQLKDVEAIVCGTEASNHTLWAGQERLEPHGTLVSGALFSGLYARTKTQIRLLIAGR